MVACMLAECMGQHVGGGGTSGPEYLLSVQDDRALKPIKALIGD